jgi:dTDP-4-dehydrorhamnose 3,5-epimerase
LTKNEIAGIEYFESLMHPDNRGVFTKVFSLGWVETQNFELGEVFYSTSTTGVIRGLHLQVDDAAGPRIVNVQNGLILDVLLDLRQKSPTYLNMRVQEMSPKKTCSVYVPAGVAHGFQALEESQTLYISSKIYNPNLDTGVDALSLELDWPIKEVTRSARDQVLPSIQEWVSMGSNDKT